MKTENTRALCANCKWVDETDTAKNYHFRGVELCPKHAAAPELLTYVLRIREAFYVTNKTKDLREAFASGHELVRSLIK